MRAAIIGVLSVFFLCQQAATADEWKIDSSHSTAGFTVRHMMVSNVRGAFARVSGVVSYDGKDVTKATVEATIDVKSIDTREPKRDEHLLKADFLDAEKYPLITFKSKKIERLSADEFKMVGDLTLHGVSKEVSLNCHGLTKPVKDPWGNMRLGVSAGTTINRKDFGISYNQLLDSGGAVVGDEVRVELDMELLRSGDEKKSAAK